MTKACFLLVVAFFAMGCRQKIPLQATATELQGKIHVSLRDAHAKNERIHVVATVTNWGDKPIYIDRNMWALRLPSGETLARVQASTQKQAIFQVDVGKSRDLTVSFHKRGYDVSSFVSADLVIGGVKDHPMMPGRTIGEVHITR